MDARGAHPDIVAAARDRARAAAANWLGSPAVCVAAIVGILRGGWARGGWERAPARIGMLHGGEKHARITGGTRVCADSLAERGHIRTGV